MSIRDATESQTLGRFYYDYFSFFPVHLPSGPMSVLDWVVSLLSRSATTNQSVGPAQQVELVPSTRRAEALVGGGGTGPGRVREL